MGVWGGPSLRDDSSDLNKGKGIAGVWWAKGAGAAHEGPGVCLKDSREAQWVQTCIAGGKSRRFLGAPVVEIPHFHCRGTGSISGPQELRSCMPQRAAKSLTRGQSAGDGLGVENLECAGPYAGSQYGLQCYTDLIRKPLRGETGEQHDQIGLW